MILFNIIDTRMFFFKKKKIKKKSMVGLRLSSANVSWLLNLTFVLFDGNPKHIKIGILIFVFLK